jgi:glycosidase
MEIISFGAQTFITNHPSFRLPYEKNDSNFQARKFAQVLQFTWPGCPLVYYGDELGLEGADDPHNRAPMPWGRDAWRRAKLGAW